MYVYATNDIELHIDWEPTKCVSKKPFKIMLLIIELILWVVWIVEFAQQHAIGWTSFCCFFVVFLSIIRFFEKRTLYKFVKHFCFIFWMRCAFTKYANSQRHGTVLSHGGQMTWIFSVFFLVWMFDFAVILEETVENVIHNMVKWFSFFCCWFVLLNFCWNAKKICF